MHGRDAFFECGFTPHHADAATTERQRRDRPKLTKAVLPHDYHLPRRFGFAIRSKPPPSMSFAGDAILSARLLSSTTADFGPEVVINLPPSRACARAVLTLDAVCTVLTALFREDKLRNEASVGQAAL